MNVHWCQEPEKGLLKPDLVLLLILSEKEISKRPNYGDERYENKETQEKVANMFMKMSEEQEDWDVVEADGGVDDVHQLLLEKVMKKVSEVGHKPIEILNFKQQS